MGSVLGHECNEVVIIDRNHGILCDSVIMNVMDDTLADDSGIPFLSCADDIPVHSTPIKGEKIPLPSTRNAMKHFMGQSGRNHDYSEVESLMCIKSSDGHPTTRSEESARLGQTGPGSAKITQRFTHHASEHNKLSNGNHYNETDVRRHKESNVTDLSNLDNLRPKVRVSEHPSEKAFYHERSSSPKPNPRSSVHKPNEVFKKPIQPDQKVVHKRALRHDPNDYTRRSYEKISSSTPQYETDSHLRHSYNSNKLYEIIERQRKSDDRTLKESEQNNSAGHDSLGSPTVHRHNMIRVEINTRRYDSTDRTVKNTDNFKSFNDDWSKTPIYERSKSPVNERPKTPVNERSKTHVNERPRTPVNERPRTPVNEYSNDQSKTTESEVKNNSPKERKKDTDGAVYTNSEVASMSRPFSSSKHLQNTSLSELENATVFKQRHEIQLLMAELKDRDKELGDMMTSHQQQLVAWQQDRARLCTLEKKCTQYEDDLRAKTNQLRTTVTNLKALKSTEIEHRQELNHYKSTIDKLNSQNADLKEEISQLQTKNSSLQENMTELSTKVGRLEAREEELTTSIRLKEKDISSATSHMRELSERLQQLDLRCKECQDREKEALKDKDEWKRKFEQSREDYHTLSGELDRKRKDVVRLSEENKSARAQLALLGKEACMMEKCKDELIESMRVKQERTDTQLRNLRELYDRQVQEVASLQLQVDNSKELIYRQQNSIDEQQLSTSYQGRSSHASEYSPERSSASQKYSWQRQKSSPNSKVKESDITGSHTQSSGYQSQLYENQSVPPGSQPVPAPDNMTGPHRRSFSSGYQSQFHENQSVSAGSQAVQLSDNTNNMTGSHRRSLSSGYQSELHVNQSGAGAGNQYSTNVGNQHKSVARIQEQTGPKSQEKSEHYGESRHSQNNHSSHATGQNISDNSGSNLKTADDSQKSKTDNQSSSNYAYMYKFDSENYNRRYGAYKDSVPAHREQEQCDSNLNQTTEGQSTQLADDSSFHTPPRLKTKLKFDSPERKDGFVVEKVQCKVTNTARSALNDESGIESIDPRRTVPTPYGTNMNKQMGNSSSPSQDDRRRTVQNSYESNMIRLESNSSPRGQVKGQSRNITGANDESKKPYDKILANSETGVEDYTKQPVPLRDEVDDYNKRAGEKDYIKQAGNEDLKKHNSSDAYSKRTVDVDYLKRTEDVDYKNQAGEEDYKKPAVSIRDEEFESRYTFENKLTSFLEGLDDIEDDSIWDEKPTNSYNFSMSESSPANKLRKLLIESQEMIHSLEKTAESPRHTKARETQQPQSEN